MIDLVVLHGLGQCPGEVSCTYSFPASGQAEVFVGVSFHTDSNTINGYTIALFSRIREVGG